MSVQHTKSIVAKQFALLGDITIFPCFQYRTKLQIQEVCLSRDHSLHTQFNIERVSNCKDTAQSFKFILLWNRVYISSIRSRMKVSQSVGTQ
jgi:hypothetical protein